MKRALLAATLASSFCAACGSGPAKSPSPAKAEPSASAPSSAPDSRLALAELEERTQRLNELTAASPKGAPRSAEPAELVATLTRTYVEQYATLPARSRVALISALCDARDASAAPAFRKALDEFAKSPSGLREDSDIRWAARAYGEQRLTELGPSMLTAFERLEAHTLQGGVVYRDFSAGMVSAPQAAWAPALLSKLTVPLPDPTRATSKDEARRLIDPFRDQLFWQLVAAQVLGELRDASAVRPLLEVLLDPSKMTLNTTVLLALVKIGEPSVAPTVSLLNGQDKELMAFEKSAVARANAQGAAPTHVQLAAAVLGTLGRSEAIAPMVALLNGPAPAADRCVVAQELSKIPATPASKAAFKKTFESLPANTFIQGNLMPQILAEASAGFYDPTFVPWLLERARKQGNTDEGQAIRQGLIMAALRLATPAQMDAVTRAAKRDDLLPVMAPAIEVVGACGESADCYVAAIQKPENQARDRQFAGIKAAYMIGIYGDPAARDKLIDGLGSIEDVAVRFVAAQTIDQLTPRGSREVAARLDEIIAKNKQSGDPDKIAADQPLQQVSYRLFGRSD